MRASDICAKAAEIVAGDREKTHGDKTQNHRNIAALWSAYLGIPVSAHDAALMMVLLKIARVKTGDFNLDDYVDGAGYMACAGEIGKRT